VPQQGSRACGVMVKDLRLPKDMVLVTIIRGEDTLLPRGDTMLEPGDSVIAITSIEREADLKNILTGK